MEVIMLDQSPSRAKLRASAMLDALQATGPSEALAAKLGLYGQFVGSWRVDIDYFPPEGPERHAEGEWHFDWVLDGRAIQDVWIFPARHLRGGGTEPWHFYGSTIRVYDPALDAWHIRFFEPTRPFEIRQTGRAEGRDIVQLGEEEAGVTRRWRFVEVTERSFRWLGEMSRDQGATWSLEMEMRARRAA
jgi:hypothetical protein